MQPWLYFIICVMPPHTLWLLYPLVTAFRAGSICMAQQAPGSWNTLAINWKQAGARTAQLPPPSPSALALSGALGPSAAAGRGLSSAQITAQLSCVFSAGPGHFMLCLSPSAPAEPVWAVSSGWCSAFQLCSIQGAGGSWAIPAAYFLELPSIFHRLVEEGKSLRVPSLFFFSWEVWILLLAHRS